MRSDYTQTGSSHGGSDALGVPAFDFSSNSNACGPCPTALAAVQAADSRHYPDPAYTALQSALAAWHGVDAWRIVLGASASELIFRLSALARQTAASPKPSAYLEAQHYGDYERAALAHRLELSPQPAQAQLIWACEPSSPCGQVQANLSQRIADLRREQILALDCAYAPLRLDDGAALALQQRDRIWQLYTPNKALGLTGVRAAYVVAPSDANAHAAQLQVLAPSWPVGAHGVAMLHAWVQADTQRWLSNSLAVLRRWKQAQLALCAELGWHTSPSIAPYYCAQAPVQNVVALLQHLRLSDVKLRDCTSFGLAGTLRMNTLNPEAQEALKNAYLSYGGA